MDRRTAAIAVPALIAVIVFSAWYHVSQGATGSTPGGGTTPLPTAPTTTPSSPASASAAGSDAEQNRAERTGPSWSPRDLVKDGQVLKIGPIVPGGFKPVMAGTDAQDASDAGYIEPDEDRSDSCEGPAWKWAGDLAGGLDVVVGDDDKILSLGLTKAGLETPEGISIGNTYGALKKTYGDRLQGPQRMDFGQAGAFLQDGDNWIGFSMDNEPGKLDDSSRIAFIEVTHGKRPTLVRDGC